MKAITTLICLLVAISSYAVPNKVFDKLSEVNKCWTEQTDIHALNYPEYTERNDREWIRIHLELVEQTLRSRNTVHLTQEQKANRQAALDHLNEYWHTGAFPINDKYAERTPIFIDDYDNFCAVGYLVKATGHEDVSRMIASKTNLAYVREMNYPELFAWADNYGFTVDELAWIQPQYPWYEEAREIPIGGGTNGVIYTLLNSGLHVVAAGSFDTVDGNIAANNIAMFSETNNGFVWDTVSTGVNGTVYALESYKGNLIVGGDFTLPGATGSNIAIWDWWNELKGLGCISGTVNDLLEHSWQLYAVGDFDLCTAQSEVNFARWDDSNQAWQPISGLTGHVNTINAVSGTFYLGGSFTYQNDTLNIIKWTEKNGFEKFDKSIEKEVTDIVYYDKHMYASAKNGDTSNVDSLLYILQSDNWNSTHLSFYIKNTTGNFLPSFHALEAGDDIHIGGHFRGSSGQDAFINSFRFQGRSIPDAQTDGPIYDIVTYKGHLIFGGDFRYDHDGKTRLNSICTRVIEPLTVKQIERKNISIKLYPNPAKSNITIENNFNASELRLYDIQGRLISSYTVKGKKATIALPEIAAGTYITEISNAEGLSATERLIID